MSKLIERLEKVGVVLPVPMGFGMNRAATKPPPLLLIALSGPDQTPPPSDLAVDCFVVVVANAGEPEARAARAAAGDGLWGMWADTLTSAFVDAIKDEGGDFFVFSNVNTPVDLLASEDLGRLMSVAADMREEEGRTLEDLPIDGIVLTGLEEDSPLTVGDLMRIQGLRELISKPLLLLRSKALSQGELELVRDAGVQAVVLDVRVLEAAEVAVIRSVVEEMPARKLKRERLTATLPRLSSGVASRRDEDEEEDEDEDYD